MAGPHDETAVSSLAEYVLSLMMGSRCFCCGRPLNTAEADGSQGQYEASVQRLTCPHCGSEVADFPRSSAAQAGDGATFAGAQKTAA